MKTHLRRGHISFKRLRLQGPELAALSLRRMDRRELRDLARFLTKHPHVRDADVMLGLTLCEAARRYLSPKPKF